MALRFQPEHLQKDPKMRSCVGLNRQRRSHPSVCLTDFQYFCVYSCVLTVFLKHLQNLIVSEKTKWKRTNINENRIYFMSLRFYVPLVESLPVLKLGRGFSSFLMPAKPYFLA
ncbi:hypothetical protein Hanom_Chr05g00466821 [Helianthus anomalus]